MLPDGYPVLFPDGGLSHVIELKLIEKRAHLLRGWLVFLHKPHAVYLLEIGYLHILLKILLLKVINLALQH